MLVNKNGKAPKQELLDIYRNNLYATLINALKITYPKFITFKRKTSKNFAKNSSNKTTLTAGNLDNYGENFAEFLQKKEDCFLSDLAKLEMVFTDHI